MILIADSGGTGTDWCVSSEARIVVHTPGLNPHHGLPTADELRQQLLAAGLYEFDGTTARVAPTRPEHTSLFFYGAGCTSDQQPRVQALLAETLGCSPEQVHVESDIVGAARAVCGDSPGLVAILGTGANACYWDGSAVHPGTRSLGYVLGDEGSGAYIGRLLLRALLRGGNTELADDFEQETGLTYADILERVYRQPQANAFLASLAPFAAKHREHALVHGVLDKAFTDFAEQLLLPLVAEHNCRSVGFVGSIAEHFQPELTAALARHSIAISRIVAKPIEALADYHERKSLCR